MNLDHAVLWVEEANRSLKFYKDILGLDTVRAEAFAEGKARFPSVRVNEKTIFDIMESCSNCIPSVKGEPISGMVKLTCRFG